MRQTINPRTLILAVLVTALVLRLGAAGWWQGRQPLDKPFAFGDSASYWVLAQSIHHGVPYQYGGQGMRTFRMPGYPILLAGVFAVLGDDISPLWARGLGAALGTLAVAGVLWLGAELFDVGTGIAAGTMASFYPGAIGMSVFILSEAAFCPLFLFQFICWTRAFRSTTSSRVWIWAIAGGVAAGCATLVRPSWLPFTPAAVLFAILVGRQRYRQCHIGIVMCTTMAVLLMPWWIRNYQVTGRFVPTTLQVGASLYDSWNPHATGASDMRFVDAIRDEQLAWDAAQPFAPPDTFEYRLDQRFRTAAWSWAKTHPGRVLQLAGIKLIRMWSPWPHAAEMQSWSFRLATLIGYTPLLLLGVWGSWKFARRGWPYVLCLLPAGHFTILHMIFVSSIRYRQPAMLSFIVIAAGGLVVLFRQIAWRPASVDESGRSSARVLFCHRPGESPLRWPNNCTSICGRGNT